MKTLVGELSRRARERRAKLLLERIRPEDDWRILDLGGGTGRHIRSIFPDHKNIVVCDHSAEDLSVARGLGFETVLADGSDRLPFGDGEFDFVFCSSVLEHVTGPKDEVTRIRSTTEFRATAWHYQTKFADEIKRVGKQYYVQTPHKNFMIESHTWLPMPITLLPRAQQIDLIDTTNKFWIKKTSPDFNLLDQDDMQQLFPAATILLEKHLGMSKSIMAIRS